MRNNFKLSKESFIHHIAKSNTSDSDGRIATPLRREKALVITSPDLDMIQEATERESSARSSVLSHMRHYHAPYQSTEKDDGGDEDDGPSVSSSITISIWFSNFSYEMFFTNKLHEDNWSSIFLS